MLELAGEPQVFESGTLLAGRYEVVSSVGSGGMGWVVHVIDRALDNKSTALKLLYPHLVKDERAFARFRNEVLLAQDLSHPNIVRIHDLGVTERNQYFISMEYVHGSSLKELLLASGAGGLPFEDALRILYEVCQGVAYAHSKGIVHRDLKPDNILISKLGEVKIVDFGIARSLWQENGLTKTGGAVGTPYYMAPEQIVGEALDERCDIYSLGIMAYEIVVGKRPFDDECFYNLAQLHLSENLPSCSKQKPGVPKWFDELVHRAAAKDPKDRYSCVPELLEALAPHIPASEKLRTRTRALVVSAADAYKRVAKRKSRLKRPSTHMLGWSFVIGSILLVLFATLRNNDSWKAVVGGVTLRAEDALGVPLTFFKWMGDIEITDGGKADLLKAIAENKKFYVKLIVIAGRPLDYTLEDGSTPLHEAVRVLDYGVLHELLQGNPKINVVSSEGVSPLVLAMSRGESEKARALLQHGADANLGRLDGESALHLAVRQGSREVFADLLDAGASASAADGDGNTPLHAAAVHASIEFARDLLKHGAEVDAKNSFGETALLSAIRNGRMDMVDLLLRHGASADIRNNAGQSVLDIVPGAEREKLIERLELARLRAHKQPVSGK